MVNPRVVSKGSFNDRFHNFSIEAGEEKELPDKWEDIPAIVNALNNGFLKMTANPANVPKPVVKSGEQVIRKRIEEPEAVVKREIVTEEKVSPLANEYLGQNAKSVAKSITEDNLRPEFIKELIKLEKKGKNRNVIIGLLQKKLKGVQ